MVSLNDIAVMQLSFFAFREGKRLSPGSRDAMLGIAHVVGNRVEVGWHNKDWLRILADAPVHSANNKDEMDFSSYVDVWSQDFRWLLEKCEGIYSGLLKDEITVSADPRLESLSELQPTLFNGLVLCECNFEFINDYRVRNRRLCGPHGNLCGAHTSFDPGRAPLVKIERGYRSA